MKLTRCKAIAVLGAVVLLTSTAMASEVDNFTLRDSLTHDASPVLDREVNKMIERAVHTANRQSPKYCNRVLLRREILSYGRPAPVSMFELWVTLTDQVDQAKVPVGKSIYAGHSFLEAPVVWVAGIGRSFNLGGHIIGSDKLGHFFMQGFDYFKKVEEEGKTIEEVVAHDQNEDGIFGIYTTGVKSYADIAANYDGYRFWSDLYAGGRPYVRCVAASGGGRRWKKVRDFAWADYVNDSWDEAINCPKRKPTLQAKVERNLARLGSSCPIDIERCSAIQNRPLAQYLISPKCRNVSLPGKSHFSAKTDVLD